MADELTSSLIIDDGASEVLRAIAEESENTASALAEVQTAMAGLDGGVAVSSGDIAELERELNDTIDLSVLEEINARQEKAWQAIQEEIEEESEEILESWEEAGERLEEIPQDAQQEAAGTKKGLLSGIKGLGADIAGWWSLIKDVFDKIYAVFEKLSEEADKLAMRMARYGLVAESEGKTGGAKLDRSRELYKQQQKFAQALGVMSEGFNETVLNMYSNGQGVLKSIEDAQVLAASSYMAMDIAGLRGKDKDAVMGEIQSMVSVGIADPDQIQEAMKIAPNILRTIEQQWQKNQNGKAYKLSSGEEITDATGKIAVLAQEGQITAELVAQAMINSAEETNKTWNTLPQTWEKISNRAKTLSETITARFLESFASAANSPVVESLILSVEGIFKAVMSFVDIITPLLGDMFSGVGSAATGALDIIAGGLNMTVGLVKWVYAVISKPLGGIIKFIGEIVEGVGGFINKLLTILPYVGSNIWKIGDIFRSMIRGIKSYFMQFINWFKEKWAGLLETVGEFSDTAAEAAKKIRASVAESRKEMEEYDRESNELKREWMGNEYEEYAEKNDLRWVDGLNISGFLEDILKNQEAAPGSKTNPAQVKGKVAIDGEYFDIIKRAAGIEIVNRYTTLRPTVNARFGDIHQVDARDVIGELGRQIQDAEGAALSDAQALGA